MHIKLTSFHTICLVSVCREPFLPDGMKFRIRATHRFLWPSIPVESTGRINKYNSGHYWLSTYYTLCCALRLALHILICEHYSILIKALWDRCSDSHFTDAQSELQRASATDTHDVTWVILSDSKAVVFTTKLQRKWKCSAPSKC